MVGILKVAQVMLGYYGCRVHLELLVFTAQVEGLLAQVLDGGEGQRFLTTAATTTTTTFITAYMYTCQGMY